MHLSYGAIKLADVPHAKALADEIFEEDCYNFELIPSGTIVLDIGACYGEFGIRCAVEKQSHVIAFEPSSKNRRILEQNVLLNSPIAGEGEIVVSPLAIGLPGVRRFMHRSDHPAGSMFAFEAARHGCTGEVDTVECAAIDDQIRLAKERWGDLPIVVKMDCEGAEHEIFARTEWLDEVKIVAMEWHDHDGGFFRDLLVSRGFYVRVEGGGPKPRPAWDPSIGGGLLFARRGQA